MAKQPKAQVSTGGRDRQDKEPRSRGQKADSEGPSEDPRVDQINRARARAGRPAKAPGKRASGKGRDARALREGLGANAQRGNKPPPKEDEEEEEQQEEGEDLFWKDMVDGVYRSRKRRGDWDDTGAGGLH